VPAGAARTSELSRTAGAIVYRRLLGYVRAHARELGAVALAMVVYAATDTGFAALMKPMLDGSFVAKDHDVIRLIPLALIGLFLIRGIAGFVSTYGMTWVGRSVIRALREQLFSQMLRLPMGFFESTTSGQLIAKLTYDVEQVAQAATDALTTIVRDTLTVLGLLAWMFYLNGWLALVFLVVGPFIAALMRLVGLRFRRLSVGIQDSIGDVAHVAEEVVEGQRVVKTFGGDAYERERFRRANDANRRLQMKLSATAALSVPVVQLVAACALAGIVYLATLQPMLERVTVGTFMSFIVAMMMLLAPIKRLTAVNNTLQKGIAAAQSVFVVLDERPEPDTGSHTLTRARGEIRFEDVSFAYSPAGGSVLRHIDLDIAPGETVALVGRSGSGKSTLVSLLPRFYEVQSGRIRLDGTELKELTLSSLREQIALVGQHVTLFNDTIACNIAYGRLGGKAGEAEIIAAAEAAHAMEFIRELPQGLQTLVGANGVRLSGGQRQRLAIARALLKNAPVLILDEATSALDTESERYIQAALEPLMHGRTTLVIAHRLSTVERAERIVVLDAGRIVESGTHAKLLSRGGLYASLHRMQFQAEAGSEVAAGSGRGHTEARAG